MIDHTIFFAEENRMLLYNVDSRMHDINTKWDFYFIDHSQHHTFFKLKDAILFL